MKDDLAFGKRFPLLMGIMTSALTCPRCGCRYSSHLLKGACPDCLIRVTLKEEKPAHLLRRGSLAKAAKK